MQASFAVDWIRVTTKDFTVSQMLERFEYGFKFEDWATFKPTNGYDCGLQNPYGHSIMWCTYRDDMGVNIQFDGRACNELHHAGIDMLQVVKDLSIDGCKFTRLDLAIDLRGVTIDIVGLLDCEHEGSANNDPELYQKGRNARGGATLYIGSRQSEKYLRIYDKAKERKLTDLTWVRVELELKSDTATKIAKRLVHMTELEAGVFTQGMMNGMYRPRNDAYNDAMAVEPIKVGSTKNESHDTYDWMMVRVAKTMARLMLELPHRDPMRTFQEEVNKYIRELAAKAITPPSDHETV